MQPLFIMLLLSLSLLPAEAGLAAAGMCYAGCAAVACACFAAAGFTFGTVPIAVIVATPALAACNAAFGVCEKSCWYAVLLPIP